MAAKRPRLEVSINHAITDNFVTAVCDDLLQHIMQLLDLREVLKMAKTCKRLANLYNQKRSSFRRFEDFNQLLVPYKMSSNEGPLFNGNGTGDGDIAHCFWIIGRRRTARLAPSHYNFKLEDSKTEILVAVAKADDKFEWPYVYDWETPDYSSKRHLWKCFIRRGTRIRAFIRIVRFISENFTFQNLHIENFDKPVRNAPPKFSFQSSETTVVSCGDFDETDLLPLARIATKLEVVHPRLFKAPKAIFDNPLFLRWRSFRVEYDQDTTGWTWEITDDHIIKWIRQMEKFSIGCMETLVTLKGVKTVIEEWTTSDKAIDFWHILLRLERYETLERLKDQLLAGRAYSEFEVDNGQLSCTIKHQIGNRSLCIELYDGGDTADTWFLDVILQEAGGS